jgi:hypothetical protein
MYRKRKEEDEINVRERKKADRNVKHICIVTDGHDTPTWYVSLTSSTVECATTNISNTSKRTDNSA